MSSNAHFNQYMLKGNTPKLSLCSCHFFRIVLSETNNLLGVHGNGIVKDIFIYGKPLLGKKLLYALAVVLDIMTSTNELLSPVPCNTFCVVNRNYCRMYMLTQNSYIPTEIRYISKGYTLRE